VANEIKAKAQILADFPQAGRPLAGLSVRGSRGAATLGDLTLTRQKSRTEATHLRMMSRINSFN